MSINTIEFKKEIIEKALNTSISLVAKQYSLSVLTINNWIKQFKKDGINGLKDKRGKDTKHANKLSSTIELEIIELKKNNPKWSAKRIKEYLDLDFSIQVINKKIREYGLNKRQGFQEISEDIKPLQILIMDIQKLPLENNLKDIDFKPIPQYLIRFICYKTGFTFFSFAYEKSNLTLSIFADYILKNLGNSIGDLGNISIVTNKSSAVYSASNDSLFQNILKKYGVKQIIQTVNEKIYFFIDDSNFIKIVNI